MTAKEYLYSIKKYLFKLQNFSLTKEQEEAFSFIEERLDDGEKAENALLQIQCICVNAN